MTPEQRLARKARRYRYVDQGLCPWDGHTATHGQLCDRCYATRQAWLTRADKRTGLPVGRKRSPQGDAWAQAYVAGGTLRGIARRGRDRGRRAIGLSRAGRLPAEGRRLNVWSLECPNARTFDSAFRVASTLGALNLSRGRQSRAPELDGGVHVHAARPHAAA